MAEPVEATSKIGKLRHRISRFGKTATNLLGNATALNSAMASAANFSNLINSRIHQFVDDKKPNYNQTKQQDDG